MMIDKGAKKITLMNLEDIVSVMSWKRGLQYFTSGAVFNLNEKEPGKWNAIVKDERDYKVEVSLDGELVEWWYCDCPHEGKDACKHIVAVLLAIGKKLKVL